MPLLTDPETIRRLLNRDRDWAAYAIGDLAPGFVEHCEWRSPGNGSTALMLIYRGFATPIVFAMGMEEDVRFLFEEISEPVISLHVRPDSLHALSSIYRPVTLRTMWRMTLRHQDFRPVTDADRFGVALDVATVGEEHVRALQELYADGNPRGEAPTFFSASMLRQRTFRGIWDGNALVAIAGTHLYSAELGVCAIGNVYTRSDHRGRGLAACVTSAVVTHAIADAVETIVLNVDEHNVAAQQVYARLGFTRYGQFVEGDAARISATA